MYFSITCPLMYWASAGGDTNSVSHAHYMGISYSPYCPVGLNQWHLVIFTSDISREGWLINTDCLCLSNDTVNQVLLWLMEQLSWSINKCVSDIAIFVAPLCSVSGIPSHKLGFSWLARVSTMSGNLVVYLIVYPPCTTHTYIARQSRFKLLNQMS